VRWVRAVIALAVVGCSFHAGRATGDGSQGDVPIVDASPIDATSSWWDPGWTVRLHLTIKNNLGRPLPAGYQVGFPFELDGMPCSAANRDVARIVRDNVDLPRVTDDVAGALEWIWFPLQIQIPANATSTEYFLYCKNPTPSPAPKDPALVFDFFESFLAGFAQWDTQGSISAVNGVLTLGNGDSILSKTAFGPDHAVDFRLKASGTTGIDFWAGFQASFTNGPPWDIWYTINANAKIFPSFNEASEWDGTPLNLDTMMHLYGVENYGDSSTYRFEDVLGESHTNPSPLSSPIKIRLSNFNSGQNKITFDMVRLRKAVNPGPTVTVGAVETF
jgi:hypothetical protein